jgi:pimeloyl-ACP methyl ester carboxylesterase
MTKLKTMTWLLAMALVLGAGWLWTPDKARSELEARYARGPGDFVSVAGLRLHVRDSGPAAGSADAPVVVLLHGFGSSLHTWEPWAQALAATHRVVRYDQPGAGLTGADPTGDYSDERGMQVLLALMDQLGIARASVVGHSMGGRLAFRFAAAHPTRVDKLVLVAPDGFASPGFEYDKPTEVPALARLMRHALPRALLRMSLEPAYADKGLMTEDTVTRYHDMMLAPGVRGALLARMEQMMLREPTAVLRTITAPTLLLWGDEDAMIPVANAQDYLRALRDARLVSLPGVGHLPHEEAPAASLPAVQAFLQPH